MPFSRLSMAWNRQCTGIFSAGVRWNGARCTDHVHESAADMVVVYVNNSASPFLAWGAAEPDGVGDTNPFARGTKGPARLSGPAAA
ncbi:hypothetical protein GTS_53540 [Gandjariella thermophila]|uniref:Uncharacterized protein n=1 Tax=Gandjariella thermophila TaxID=1931992 RepID=A0A4D4JAN4_9PSEU|nr:hypothetical protein GTS_53540 [Gandjariella thermophila]